MALILNRKLNIDKNSFYSHLFGILLTSYFVFGLLGLFLGYRIFFYLSVLFGCFLSCSFIIDLIYKFNRLRPFCILIIIWVIFSISGIILSNFLHSKIDLGFLTYAILSPMVAYCVVYKHIKIMYLEIIFAFILLVLITCVLLSLNPNIILAVTNSSRNGISIILINIYALIFIAKIKNNKQVNLLPVLLIIIICAWVSGRSGIISSILLLFSVILYNYYFFGFQFFLKRKKRKIYDWIAAFTFLSIYTTTFLYLITKIDFQNVINNALNSFDRGISFFGDSRYNFFTEYISYLNIDSFLFGFYLKNSGLFNEAGNSHNSFIHLHSLTGLFGILLIIIITFFLIKFFFTNFFGFLLLTALIFRGFTDTIYFFEIYDFILLSTIGILSENKFKNGISL